MSTARQQHLIEAVRALNAAEIPITYERLRERLGLASKSGVHRLVHALIEQGRLHALPRRNGTLRLVEAPTRAAMERWTDAELMMVRSWAGAILAGRERVGVAA